MLADTRAVVSVEAALALALVMLPLLLGLFDLGTALTVRLRVDRAVQAGLFGAWGVAGASAGQIAQAAQAGGGSGQSCGVRLGKPGLLLFAADRNLAGRQSGRVR